MALCLHGKFEVIMRRPLQAGDVTFNPFHPTFWRPFLASKLISLIN